jgi:hypothetical protein
MPHIYVVAKMPPPPVVMALTLVFILAIGYTVYKQHTGSTAGCKVDADCDGGQICVGGQCTAALPGFPCAGNSDCIKTGQLCINKQCSKACTASTDCDAGQQCAADNYCHTVCDSNQGCPSNQKCETGWCQ